MCSGGWTHHACTVLSSTAFFSLGAEFGKRVGQAQLLNASFPGKCSGHVGLGLWVLHGPCLVKSYSLTVRRRAYGDPLALVETGTWEGGSEGSGEDRAVFRGDSFSAALNQ